MRVYAQSAANAALLNFPNVGTATVTAPPRRRGARHAAVIPDTQDARPAQGTEVRRAAVKWRITTHRVYDAILIMKTPPLVPLPSLRQPRAARAPSTAARSEVRTSQLSKRSTPAPIASCSTSFRSATCVARHSRVAGRAAEVPAASTRRLRDCADWSPTFRSAH
jgi:hypothetical protein